MASRRLVGLFSVALFVAVAVALGAGHAARAQVGGGGGSGSGGGSAGGSCPSQVVVGQSFTCSVFFSKGPDPSAIISWGDGSSSSAGGGSASHAYSAPGTYTVTVNSSSVPSTVIAVITAVATQQMPVCTPVQANLLSCTGTTVCPPGSTAVAEPLATGALLCMSPTPTPSPTPSPLPCPSNVVLIVAGVTECVTATPAPVQTATPTPSAAPTMIVPLIVAPATTAAVTGGATAVAVAAATPVVATSGSYGSVQVSAGNDLPRIPGREQQPPVGISSGGSGETATLTLTNNTLRTLDLTHTVTIQPAGDVQPAAVSVSDGSATIQGNQVVWSGFTLNSSDQATATITLTASGATTSAAPAIAQVHANAFDAQTGEQVIEDAAPGSGLNLAAGWNLVAGPAGAMFSGVTTPLYTFQAGDTGYETIATGVSLKAGEGYWLFTAQPLTLNLPPAAANAPLSVPAPAGQFVLVGNSLSVPARVNGADQVLTYSPTAGYQAATVLQPGQGAWAISFAGGTITLSPAAATP